MNRPRDYTSASRLKSDIDTLLNRADIIQENMLSHQSTTLTLIKQQANEELIEEHRDKATAFYESYLDTMIYIGKLNRRLRELEL